MELGAEISQKVKKTIKKQLKTLGCYVDDELPEYIMVMIANKRTEEQMVDDLHLFLNDEAEKFVSWLTVVLSRIQKAMELPDIDAIVGDVELEQQDSKKKPKKSKKDKISESDEDENVKNEKHDRKKTDEKRRPKEIKDREMEEKERSEKRNHNPERVDRHKEKEGKESERREKERKQRDERDRREKEREEEVNKRRLEREEEISKRRAAREKRYQEEKEKREERKKKEREQLEEKENKEKQRKHKDPKKIRESRRSEDADSKEKEDDADDDEDEKKDKEAAVRREAEHEAKRIENRPNRNPMEFVKQIAKDITDQIASNQPTAPSTKDDISIETADNISIDKSDSAIHVDSESKNGSSENTDVTRCENVSLQAVSQYDDVENDMEKGDYESQHRIKKDKHRRKSGSRSRSKSGTRHQKDSRAGHKSRKSKSQSAERSRKHHRSHSRSRSKERHDGRSRKDTEKRSSSRKDDSHVSRTKNVSDEESGKKRDRDKSKSVDKNESKRRGRSGSPHKRNSHSHHSHRNNNEDPERRNTTDTTEEVEEEVSAKPSLSSQVQIFTDFKRKPSLSKHHQASSVLLKRAVTEVVNEKPDGEENEDDVELDYNETNDENDEFSDEASNNEVLERRVINFDKEKSGLPTITVNFNQDNSNCDNESKQRSRSHDRDRNRRGTNDVRHSRGRNHSHSHSRGDDKNVDRRYQGISKYDARYTILRSRLEHEGPPIPNDRINSNDRINPNDRKVHHHKHRSEKSSNRDKNLSSMVADLEEKSRRRGDRGGWRDNRRDSNESSGRHKERQMGSHRKHHHMADVNSSADEEEIKQMHVKALKERRIEMQESDEGDLRDLLVGKRERKSSSEDEETSARRLREKIKEEKHKILFGKLKPEERDRSKRERENLVEQLKTRTKRRRMTETKESPEWIEKVPEQNDASKYNDGNEENSYVENITDIDEDGKNEDDWQDINEDYENGDMTHDNDEVEEDQDDDSVHHQHISQNDLEEVSDEELADDSDKEMDGEDANLDMETTGESKDEVEQLEIGKEGKDVEELEEEEVEEVVEIEVEVSDNENLDGDEQSTICRSGDVVVINDDGNKINDIVDLVEGDKNISPAVLKDSMHVESSEDSPFRDENIDEDGRDGRNMDKYDRKSKQKSSKRKRMRHEFIVTLEGLGDGKKLSIETGGREKSPKIRRLPDRAKSERHRRHRHMSRSQSDEEFEEIMRRKEEEEKRSIEQSRIFDGRRTHRSRSQSSSEKESKHRELRVNREIMLAENKLKTQKVFKKCLETVQNVTNNLTVNNVVNNLEQVGAPKAAFLNPNFQPKLPTAAVAMIPANVAYNDAAIKVIAPPTLNPKPICNLSVAEKIILPPTVLTPREKLTVKPLRIERSKDFVLPTGALDIVALPHVDISALKKNLSKPTLAENQVEKPVAPHSTKETPLSTETSTYAHSTGEVGLPVSSALPVPVVSEESRSTAVNAKPTIQERCAFWPVCKNQTCPYIHPSVNCKLFPNCSYGQHCIYIHPPCMFGEGCSNATCPFMHVQAPPPAFTGFSQICKFYPNCAKADCPFKHVAKPCRYGASCNNSECSFSHDDVRSFSREDVQSTLPASSLKWVAEKPHVSERKFAAAEAIVSHIPVTIVTSS